MKYFEHTFTFVSGPDLGVVHSSPIPGSADWEGQFLCQHSPGYCCVLATPDSSSNVERGRGSLSSCHTLSLCLRASLLSSPDPDPASLPPTFSRDLH